MKPLRHTDRVTGTNITMLQHPAETLPQFIDRCVALEAQVLGTAAPPAEPVLEDQPA